MVRTRFSAPEIALDDPVVEIHESQLRKLRARANLALPSAIVGVLALALIAAGIVRVERSIKEVNGLAEGRSGVVAAQVKALSDELTTRTDPELIAQIAMESNAAPIAGATSTAQRALLVAHKAVASLEPVTEQMALVDGRLIQIRSEISGLSNQGTAQAAQVAEVSQGLDALRSTQQEGAESLSRRLAAHESRFELQDREATSARTWTRAAAAGAAIGIGIASAHALGHTGR